MQSLREGFLSGGPVGRVTCPLRGVAPSRGVWRRGSRFMLGRETSESSSSAKKRQNPETFLKGFGVVSVAGAGFEPTTFGL